MRTHRVPYYGAIALLVFALSGCTGVTGRSAPGTPCETAAFRVSDGFDGARRGQCLAYRDGHVRLTITPENEGDINDSAWYAFVVHPDGAGVASIELRYRGGHHRYVPKISRDGKRWTALDPASVVVDKRGRRARFAVDLDGGPVTVAAQELVLPEADAQWVARQAASSPAAAQSLGVSGGGREIPMLQSVAEHREWILLVGRQHPPEVSGALAMKPFVETLLGDSSLAREFRDRFAVVAVPMVNPDGVVAGHWRHNLGGVDLNRDWGPFTQPETQLLRGLIDDMEREQRALRFFVDFHSTRRNLFYTQPNDDASEPTNAAKRWLDAARDHLADYPFDQEERHNQGLPTSKNYINQRFGIPAITYEVGDETDRAISSRAAVVFANELMRLLLSSPPQP